MIAIKDLAGLGKPLTRLVEVISQGVGAVTRSHLVRKNADAKSYEIKVIAAALHNAEMMHGLPVAYQEGAITAFSTTSDHQFLVEPLDLDERSRLRVEFTERRRQRNVESITSLAAQDLVGVTEVADAKPDADWISRFFSAAQDISSEQMQELWGRILAGEIKRPGSFSFRTLDIVRNLTQSEAQLLEQVGPFLTLVDEDHLVVSTHDRDGLDRKNVPSSVFFKLVELDIVYPGELLIRLFNNEAEQAIFEGGDLALRVNRGTQKSPIDIPVWSFTKVGMDLLKLVVTESDRDHIDSLGKHIARMGLEVRLGKTRDLDGEFVFEDLPAILSP